MEKENIIMNYIAVWGWFIVSITFLVGAFIVFLSGDSTSNLIMFFAFIVSWIFCTMRGLRRRKDLEGEDEQ